MGVFFFDRAFQSLNKLLGLSRLSTIEYLGLVASIVFFTLLILLVKLHRREEPERFSSFSPQDYKGLGYSLTSVLIAIVLLAGFFLSIGTYHLHIILIIGFLLAIGFLGYTLFSHGRINDGAVLFLTTILIVILGSMFLIVGIQDEETSSDMINIRMNGFFRWSVHASHYDLAPLDAVLRVIESYFAGTNIFDPVAASASYSLHGLAAILLIYGFARELSPVSSLRGRLAALSPLIFMVYPYSFLVGLSVPPVALSQALGLIVVVLLFRGIFRLDTYPSRLLPVILPMLFYAILVHPSSLGLVIMLGFLLLLGLRKHAPSWRTTAYVFYISVILYSLKVFYTAFASGFISLINLLWDYTLHVFSKGEYLTVTTRNPGYSYMPRILLTGFGIFPAIIAAYTLWYLFRIRRGEGRDIYGRLYLGVFLIYTVFFAAAYFTSAGGVSQSRALFNGSEPYMELVFLAILVAKSLRIGLTRLKAITLFIVFSAAFTLITPNAMYLNYAAPITKPASLNTHEIAFTFTRLIDKNTFIDLYSSYGERGRIILAQKPGTIYYGNSYTTAIVYYFIAPRIIDAHSYWDPRIMTLVSIPRAGNWIRNKVFDAWVYSGFIYSKG